jgi:hypothetical protein
MYGMWPWKVPKWPWFLAEVAVMAWRDLATLVTLCYCRTAEAGVMYTVQLLVCSVVVTSFTSIVASLAMA